MILNQLINAASIGAVLLLSLLAYSKKSTIRYGYRFLSLLFLTIAFILIDDLLDHLHVYRSMPALAIIFQPLLYTFGPLIYLAVTYLTVADKKISLKTFFHFIPYLLLLGLYGFAYFLNNQQTQLPEDADDKLTEIIFLIFFFTQQLFYLLFSIKQLKRHRLTLPLFVSDLPGNDYHWLYRVIIGLSVLSLISFVEVIFNQMQISFYFSPLYLFSFYYIGVQIAKQKDVFPFTPEQIESVSDLINDKQKGTTIDFKAEQSQERRENSNLTLPIRKTVIDEDKIKSHREKLTALMDLEKPYLDSDITLPKLAKLLQLTTYQASYLINTCFGENFYTFINRYRLEKCKEMFADPNYAHLSILGIAFESGFNSKTAFNTAFKKSMGLSPKEFRDQQK
jgi:AraC-like DNA-binding protein